MAFSGRRNDRPEGLLFRAPVSPQNEPAFPSSTTPLSPLRGLASRVNPALQDASDVRGSLQRRFTTNALPTLAPIGPAGEQRRQMEQRLNNSAAFQRMSATERSHREYEELLAIQARVQAQMARIDPETRREVDEVHRLVSEPTTPTEHHVGTKVPTTSFKHRLSSTITSPTTSTLTNRPSRSGSQMTSPPIDHTRPFTSHATSQMPSKSVPNSQRNSDHEGSDDDYAFAITDFRQKAGANPNRKSMPVTALDLRSQSNGMASLSSYLGSVNTHSFLFGDDEHENTPIRALQSSNKTSPDAKTYLQLHQTDDQFPILVRRGTDSSTQYSVPSSAIDLASPESSSPEARTDRATATRHRQSLPPTAMRQGAFTGDNMTGLNGLFSDVATAKNTAANRRSLEVKFSALSENKRPSLLTSSARATNGQPKISSSYSTNDIPTLKSVQIASPGYQIPRDIQSPPNGVSSPTQRTSLKTVTTPTSRQATMSHTVADNGNFGPSSQSALQASARPFGPTEAGASDEGASFNQHHRQVISPHAHSAFYGGYGMQMLNGNMNNLSLGGYGQWPGAQNAVYQGAFGGYSQYPQPAASRFPDVGAQPRAVQQRRPQGGDESARLANVPIEALSGEIYGLCKDQHGCRFLQKKIEERNPQTLQLIFDETNPHVVELMTDPFGNYLCQKLLEYTNEDQRTAFIRSASPQMVKIALNQHGTRALQKMIEYIDTRQQIDMIIDALRYEVVQLIQDLNGNHVIQKCLNHLQQEDAQFVYDAVSTHVVTVGTHRHGCCVLQRCIDHATGPQKAQIVGAVTDNAFNLVQDPFGNYVVQYILDLGQPAFSKTLCRSFLGHISVLSRQKFSSNVIEKAIRTADDETKRLMVEEMLDSTELEKMLRDSFANYVVQTAMDYADPEMKARLIDSIHPILPAIRHTPHGRRIQSKLSDLEGRTSGNNSGQMTPNDGMPVRLSSIGGQSTHYGRPANPMSTFGQGSSGYSHGAPPYTQRAGNHPVFAHNPAPHQGFHAYGRASQPDGMGHF